MSISASKGTVVRPQHLSLSKDTLSYLTNSYLSWGSYTLGQATKSVVVMLPANRNQQTESSCHLVKLKHYQEPFVVTALKILSYFTVVLPTLAMLIRHLCATDSTHVYNTDSSITTFQREMRSPAMVHALHALGIMDREDALGNTILTEAVQHRRLQLVKWISNLPTNVINNQRNKPAIRDAVRNAILSSDQPTANAIVKILNRETLGFITSSLSRDDMNELFINNRELWKLLNSSTNNFYVSLLPYPGINGDFIDDHTNATNRIEKLTEFYALDPDMCRRLDSNGQTLFQRALSRCDEAVIDWLVQHDNNLKCFHICAALDCLMKLKTPHTTEDQVKLSAIVQKFMLVAKEEFFERIDYQDFQEIKEANRSFWDYMVTQKDYRLPDSLLRHSFDINTLYQEADPARRIAMLDRIYPLNPTILHENIIFNRALAEYDADVMAWVLNHDQYSFYVSSSNPRIRALLEAISSSPTTLTEEPTPQSHPIEPEKLIPIFRLFVEATAADLFRIMDARLIKKIQKNNPKLWDYIINQREYRIPYWFIPPKDRAQPQGVSSEEKHYQEFINELYDKAKVDRRAYPANTKKDIQKLFRKACRMIHPDKVPKDQQASATAYMQVFTSRYEEFQKSSLYPSS